MTKYVAQKLTQEYQEYSNIIKVVPKDRKIKKESVKVIRTKTPNVTIWL
jgi:hypothetical protein